MHIEIVSLSPRDEHGMMLVTAHLRVKRGKVNDNATIEVFVTASDSIAEVRSSAIEKIQQFAREVVDAPPKEHIYTGL